MQPTTRATLVRADLVLGTCRGGEGAPTAAQRFQPGAPSMLPGSLEETLVPRTHPDQEGRLHLLESPQVTVRW